MRATERIQEFAVPNVSTRDHIAFNRAYDAWLIRRGHVAENEARNRFRNRSQRKNK